MSCPYMCIPHERCAYRDQKSASDPLELEYQIAMSRHGFWNLNLGPLQEHLNR